MPGDLAILTARVAITLIPLVFEASIVTMNTVVSAFRDRDLRLLFGLSAHLRERETFLD